MSEQKSFYKWYILALVVLTNMLVAAIPSMGMSVLADEISHDLNLNLVQVGIIWGVGSLPGIVTGLLGGAVGDKFGPKNILIASSLLAGLIGASRGLVTGFTSMTVLAVLYGAINPIVTMNGFKAIGQWFPSHQLGIANGLISMGMALGFLLGAMFSATLLSPMLGGWRNVLILYGLVGAVLCIPWYFSRTLPVNQHDTPHQLSIKRSVFHVAGLKNIWLLGLALFGVGGCVQGLLGYLPLYLRGLGWQPVYADGALSAFHTISMVFVLPIALWSDRLGSRKRLIITAAMMVVIGTGLLSVVSGGMVWAAVLLAGFVRDAFMAIFFTMVLETEGVGPAYAGTATGFALALSGVGSFIAPPLGNGLAAYWPGAPFVFWSVLAVLGVVCLAQVKNRSLPEASPATSLI